MPSADAFPRPRPATAAPRRALVEALVASAALTIAYALLRPDALVSLGLVFDDVIHLALGKALATGAGYRAIHLVGAPAEVTLPPAVPAIHALFWWLGGSLERTVRLAVAANIVAVGAASFMLWSLARRALGLSVVTTFAFVLVPLLGGLAMQNLTAATGEPWLLLGWAGALLLVERLVRRDGTRATDGGGASGWRAWVLPVALGLVLGATALVRIHGLVIAGAIVVALPLMRVPRRSVATVAAVALMPVLMWVAWRWFAVHALPVDVDPSPYRVAISEEGARGAAELATDRLADNTAAYARGFGKLILGWVSMRTQLIALAAMVLFAAGAVTLGRRAPAIVLSVAAMLLTVLLWPFALYAFLVPVLPVAGLVAGHAAQRLLARLPRVGRGLAAAVLALIAARIAMLNLETRRENVAQMSGANFVLGTHVISSWIERNTRPDDRIMTDWGAVFFLQTGRQTSEATPLRTLAARHALPDAERFYAERLVRDSVDVVVLWGNTQFLMRPTLDAVERRCPGTLVPAGTAAMPDGSIPVTFLRVHADAPCLRRLADRGRRGTHVASD